jgi:hypothetical protein
MPSPTTSKVSNLLIGQLGMCFVLALLSVIGKHMMTPGYDGDDIGAMLAPYSPGGSPTGVDGFPSGGPTPTGLFASPQMRNGVGIQAYTVHGGKSGYGKSQVGRSKQHNRPKLSQEPREEACA